MITHGSGLLDPCAPLSHRHVTVREVAATVEATAARALAAGPGFAARHAAPSTGVPLPYKGLVEQVPLQVHTLVLAARATTDLLTIAQKSPVAATEGTTAVLARASDRAPTSPNKAPQLADLSHRVPLPISGPRSSPRRSD